MISTSTFTFIFVGVCLLSVCIVRYLNTKADPLQKAWNVYSAMYVTYVVIFMGLLLTLPSALPSFDNGTDSIEKLQTSDDVKQELQRQRMDIEELKNDLHSTTSTVDSALLLLALFGPIVFYNLFKSNLRIEELSGKRMGSLD